MFPLQVRIWSTILEEIKTQSFISRCCKSEKKVRALYFLPSKKKKCQCNYLHPSNFQFCLLLHPISKTLIWNLLLGSKSSAFDGMCTAFMISNLFWSFKSKPRYKIVQQTRWSFEGGECHPANSIK